MANVSIRIGHDDTDNRPACVVIDGVDMTKHILAKDFAVEIEQDEAGILRAAVVLRVRADRLDMDLPEAVIDAIATDITTDTED